MNKQVAGVDSPITNLVERELTSVWRVLKRIIHRKKCFVQIAFRLQKLHLVYKCGISITKTAFRLQIFSYQFTKLHFDLQSCIWFYNSPVRFFALLNFCDSIDKILIFAYNNITNKCKTTTFSILRRESLCQNKY